MTCETTKQCSAQQLPLKVDETTPQWGGIEPSHSSLTARVSRWAFGSQNEDIPPLAAMATMKECLRTDECKHGRDQERSENLESWQKKGEPIGKSPRSWQGESTTQLPIHSAPETGKRVVQKTGVGVRRDRKRESRTVCERAKLERSRWMKLCLSSVG
jgi:hypothetical protein